MIPTSIQELYQLFIKANQNICTDTRKLEKGALFFALKGANFNANEFAETAVNQGCSYAIVDEEKYANNSTVLFVKDVLESLQSLANYHRKQFSIPVLAITGSNGKTTNKELIYAVISKKLHTLATVGNLNNHIGVPLTLLQLNSKHEFAIIEMGANHQGEIARLCEIAAPNYGLITNIGKAHLEGFGGIEGVKKGKSELYKYLKLHQGKTFINGDDEVLLNLASENDKITYGCEKLYDVIGKNTTLNEFVNFKYTTRYGEKNWSKVAEVKTQIIGNYNFINCLAAACVGHYFKVSEGDVKVALEEYLPNMNRSQLLKTSKNTLILDAYNANPNSMKAAIENFSIVNAESKMILLGDMFELGEYSLSEHQAVVDLLILKQMKNVILVGKEFMLTTSGDFLKFDSTEQCKKYLHEQNIENKTILIKGSRGMKMELLQQEL